MAQQNDDHRAFTGFGFGRVPDMPGHGGVFILAIYRDGSLTAGAYATERGAMESAVGSVEDELDEEGERGTLDDLYARAQGVVADEGGVMEIIPSPVHGG